MSHSRVVTATGRIVSLSRGLSFTLDSRCGFKRCWVLSSAPFSTSVITLGGAIVQSRRRRCFLYRRCNRLHGRPSGNVDGKMARGSEKAGGTAPCERLGTPRAQGVLGPAYGPRALRAAGLFLLVLAVVMVSLYWRNSRRDAALTPNDAEAASRSSAVQQSRVTGSNDPDRLRSVFLKTSREINSTLPMQLDKETRLDTTMVGPGEKTVTYLYTLVNVRDEEFDEATFVKEMKLPLANAYRTFPGMATFRDLKVALRYEYRDRDGNQLGDHCCFSSGSERLAAQGRGCIFRAQIPDQRTDPRSVDPGDHFCAGKSVDGPPLSSTRESIRGSGRAYVQN